MSQPLAGLKSAHSRSALLPAIQSTCEIGAEQWSDARFAAATAVIGAADRLILTGIGEGFLVAASGVAGFIEIGIDCLAAHAGDLQSGAAPIRPGDVVVGIDTNQQVVAGALRGARRAGLHTVAITTRELTILDADVLVHVPHAKPSNDTARQIEHTFAMILSLATLAARLEPNTQLASDVTTIWRSVSTLANRLSADAALDREFVQGYDRIVFATGGYSAWIAGIVATYTSEHVAAIHAVDADAGLWRSGRSDYVVRLDLLPQPGGASASRSTRLEFGDESLPGISTIAPDSERYLSVRIPARSPAIAAIVACIVFVDRLTQIDSSPTQPT